MAAGGRQTVVVTGASAGVGRAIATAFGELGWNVGLIARSRARLDAACREIDRLGGRALAVQGDVADPDLVTRAAEIFERELGAIDVWVNSAMVTIYAPVVEITPEEFRRVTDVTYLGQVHGTLAALAHMRPRNRGTIVSVGSALAYRSIPWQGPYCAAKAATRGFIDSLRSELMHEGSAVRLTMVHLPAVNTPQFDWARSRLPNRLAPVAPIYQPEAVAQAVVAAAQDAPRELWLAGSAVKAITAAFVAPGLADRKLAAALPRLETTDEPADPNRPDNLFEAGEGQPGAHGRFDDQAKGSLIPFNPAWLRAGASVAGLAALGLAALAGARLTARPERRPLLPPRSR